MFADLNRFAIRPTQSLNILYDNRDEGSVLLKEVIKSVPDIGKLVDKEHTSIPNRSIALFTLSAMYRGTNALLDGLNLDKSDCLELACCYWKALYNSMPEWKQVAEGKTKSYIIRRDSFPLSITLKALERRARIVSSRSSNWIQNFCFEEWIG